MWQLCNSETFQILLIEDSQKSCQFVTLRKNDVLGDTKIVDYAILWYLSSFRFIRESFHVYFRLSVNFAIFDELPTVFFQILNKDFCHLWFVEFTKSLCPHEYRIFETFAVWQHHSKPPTPKNCISKSHKLFPRWWPVHIEAASSTNSNHGFIIVHSYGLPSTAEPSKSQTTSPAKESRDWFAISCRQSRRVLNGGKA